MKLPGRERERRSSTAQRSACGVPMSVCFIGTSLLDRVPMPIGGASILADGKAT